MRTASSARHRVRLFLAAALLAGCGMRERVPALRGDDARFGLLAGYVDPPPAKEICERWGKELEAHDPAALSHVSFPETNVQDACFTPVHHVGRGVCADAPPRGCTYPTPAGRAAATSLAASLDGGHRLFACGSLGPREREAAARQDARALRALASREESLPYAAVVAAGHGLAAQDDTTLAGWLPGDACRDLGPGDLVRLGMMADRTARAADAIRGGVAPVVIVTGGAVHSHLVEAFAMMHLLQCREGIEADRVIVEPCADHTHTNLRNAARWIHAIRGRAAYLLTDDHVQSDYFQDWNGFDLILGGIDDRSLRSFGYVIGSWRQASTGIDAGFWFTPYRFWAEPRDGLGSLTCVDAP